MVIYVYNCKAVVKEKSPKHENQAMCHGDQNDAIHEFRKYTGDWSSDLNRFVLHLMRVRIAHIPQPKKHVTS
jgi:hypothetical protein